MDLLIVRLDPKELKPPAPESQIEELSKCGQLPGELLTLYRHHNGMTPGSNLPMRLLSITEALEENPLVLDSEWLERRFLSEDRPLLCWSDDNSNYAGIFLGGPLQGFLFFLDHEDVDSSPQYSSIASFYSQMLEAGTSGWYEMVREFPRLSSGLRDDEELSLARQYRERWWLADTDSDNYFTMALRFLALLPPGSTAEAKELLLSENMWVQDAACNLLGRRQFLASISELAEVARRGTHNGKLGALRALREMGEAGMGVLNELRPNFPDSYACYFQT